jgi:nicotinamidase-related amidase
VSLRSSNDATSRSAVGDDVAVDLAPMLAPGRCSVVVFECQEGVVGETSLLPTLAAAVRERDVLGNIAGLLTAARGAGAGVHYCTVNKRSDGVGNAFNTPMERRLKGQGGPPSMGGIVPELTPEPGDVVVERDQGMTGFHANGLDDYLRNTGVETIVLTGVSVNIGILGTAIEAVNRGYNVIVPTDCVAGDPPEYGDDALRYSVRNLAYLSTAGDITAHWKT